MGKRGQQKEMYKVFGSVTLRLLAKIHGSASYLKVYGLRLLSKPKIRCKILFILVRKYFEHLLNIKRALEN